MKTRNKVLSFILAMAMVLSFCGTAIAAYTDAELEAFGLNGYTPSEIVNNEIAMNIAPQGYVLLENNGVLPIAKSGSVALFGNGATATVKGGTGSGIVNMRERDWIDTALEDAGYTITTPMAYREGVGRGVVATGFFGGSLPSDIEITDEWIADAASTDTAIYAIARNAGEGGDRTATQGDYYLTDIERTNIEKIAENFENVIIVLNTMIIDVSWINEIDNIDAVLFIGYGGQRTGATCVQVLNGEITPSGKVAVTWANDIYDYASSEAGFSSLDNNTTIEYYSDGIYVGYRYFDTFGVDVAYEFGYGLSYTDFDIMVDDVTIDADEVNVTVTVANVGNTYSGKEVVQVYFSAPDGELEKPYQELAAYAKTDELAPGEKQTLTLTYTTSDMSAYSEELAAYIMEAGEYIIRVGNSSRNTHVAAVGVLAESVITEQLSNQLAMEEGAELNEISKEGVAPITYEGEADEIANAERIAIDAVTFLGDNSSPYDDETVTTYLFADDAENYVPSEKLILKTKNVSGIIENNEGDGGYRTTTYKEVVEVVEDLPEGITAETAKLTDVLSGRITLKQFVACLSAEEMARLAEGDGTAKVGYIYDDEGNIAAYSHAMLGNVGRTTTELFASRYVPVLSHSDGTTGIRCDQNGVVSPQITGPDSVGGTYFYSKDGVTICDEDEEGAEKYNVLPTSFPSEAILACTWDTELAYAFGNAYGSEMKEYNVATCLGPGMNIVRNPLGGRSFEYYSEDPYLTGMTAAYVCSGVQSHHGISATIKHFWGNSQENNRNAVNNVITERTAREIYLKGFEIAIKLAQPMYLMQCYQENNGWPGSDSYDSSTDIARGEWGFKGYIMTDWGGGQSSNFISMHSGNDMIMSGNDPSNILDNYGVTAPTFEETGYVKITENKGGCFGTTYTEEWGTFVVDADGEETAVAPVESYDALSEEVLEAIAAGEAKFCSTANGNYVTWFGYNNCICLGDLQQSATHILNVMLYTQDMQILSDDLDAAFDLGLNYSETEYAALYAEAMDAPLAHGWTNVVKSEISNIAIVADTVVADNADGDTAAVNVTYTGDEAITSARLYIESDLEVVAYESDYEIEWNDGYAIIYAANGSEISGVLCTVTYAIADENGWLANGEYAVDLTLVDATGDDAESIYLAAIDGAVIIDNTYAAGDANLDGIVSNADVVALARYLVDLVEFNAEQLIAADVDGNGTISNADLIKLARSIVAA